MISLRKHALCIAAASAAALVCFFLALGVSEYNRLPNVEDATSALTQMATGADAAIGPDAGLSFPPSAAGALAPADGKRSESARDRFFAAIAGRFRLAGFKINPRHPDDSRAIIEDRESRRQWLRRRGESLAQGVSLAVIGTNEVTLSTPYGECRLALSRREGADAADRQRGPSPSGSPVEVLEFGDGAVARLEGAEESPGTWRISRDDLMAYYDEVRRRPERLEAVFDTLAPIWFVDDADGSQRIEGYRVEPCGEERFFTAMGLHEGDVIREVNGIRMTNRYAAEDLIRRFAAGDLDFAHIKMERDGEELVQSYFLK